jgi:hypothetical protein
MELSLAYSRLERPEDVAGEHVGDVVHAQARRESPRSSSSASTRNSSGSRSTQGVGPGVSPLPPLCRYTISDQRREESSRGECRLAPAEMGAGTDGDVTSRAAGWST